MNDFQFSNLKKQIEITQDRLYYLQLSHNRETGQDYKAPFYLNKPKYIETADKMYIVFDDEKNVQSIHNTLEHAENRVEKLNSDSPPMCSYYVEDFHIS